jgi:ribonuclease D
VTAEADRARALADIAQESVVGLDTETRPSFRKGEVHLPCLVQAATARRVYLFPLRQPELFDGVAGLLTDPRIVKAGVALADDLRALKQVFPFEAQNVLDLGVVARRSGFDQSGVRNLAAILLGIRIPKGARTSNWEARQLTAAQITYAATDAWVCRELYLRFGELALLPAAGERTAPGPS